jgi:uncharacterized protein (DUF111 family)
LVTPTGAAIIAHFNPRFQTAPAFRVQAVGWGAGKKDLPVPNVLRLVIGESVEGPSPLPGGDLVSDRLDLLETNIDDMNPQHYEFVMEKALGLGALDVWLTPAQMKKNRPGVQLGVLSEPGKTGELLRLLFRETTTLGIRVGPVDRLSLPRQDKWVETRWGRVRVKIGLLDGVPVNFAPEYDDCKAAAARGDATLQDVAAEAVCLARTASLDKETPGR